MGWGSVSSLADRIRESFEKRERDEQVRRQAASFRAWQRLGRPAPGMPSASELNPLGRDYTRDRMENSGLRPSNWFEVLGKKMREAEEQRRKEEERRAEEQRLLLQQTLERARGEPDEAASLLPPPQIGPPTAEEELQQLLSEPRGDPRFAATPEELAREVQGNVSRGALAEPNPLVGFTQSLLPEEILQAAGDVPVIGTGLEQSARFATSPFGIAGNVAAGPLLAGLGEAGYIGARSGAEPLPIPGYGKEAIGVAGGFGLPALGPAAGRGIGRAGLRGMDAVSPPEVVHALDEPRIPRPDVPEPDVPQFPGRGAEPPVSRETTGLGDIPPSPREIASVEPPPPRGAESPDELIMPLLTSKPGRESREVWRRYSGAKNEATLARNVWANETYAQARAAGLDIKRGAAQQSDDVQELMHRVWEGVDPNTVRPEQRELAQSLSDRLRAAEARLVEVDPEFSLRKSDEYFPHLFAAERQKGAPRGFNVRPGFARQRELEGPLADILQNRPGLSLKTWDPIETVMLHEAAVDDYIESLKAIRTLRAKGLIRPLEGADAAWRTPEIAPFKVAQELQGWVAEPRVAQALEQMFNPSVFEKHGSLKALRGLREGLFKIKVFGGLFQGVDYSLRDLGLGLSEAVRLRPKAAIRAWFSPVRAALRSSIPALDRRMLAAAEQSPQMRALYRNGLSANVDPSISEQAIKGLGGVVPQTVAGRQIPGARGLASVLEFMSGGAYQKFHRDVLEQAGLINLEKNVRKGMPLEEAARVAAEETNVFFSSIPNWQSAVKGATGRDIAKFPIFAIGEFEAWFRIPVQAPAGFAGILGTTVIMAEMLNKAFTGEWLSEKQLLPYRFDPEEIKQIKSGDIMATIRAGAPGVDYNTTFLRPELPWKGPDGRRQYLDILGQADTPFRFALDPLFALQTRVGQLPRAAMDAAAAVHGEAPMFGEPIRGPADAARAVAQQVSPISASALAGQEIERIGPIGSGFQVGGINISAQSLADRRAEVIQQEYDAGKIDRSRYTRDGEPYVPEYFELSRGAEDDPGDWNYMAQKYPELFNKDFAEERFEDIPTIEKGVIRGRLIDTARATRDEGLSGVLENAKTADLSDQQTRSSAMGQVEDILTQYGGAVGNAIDTLPPEQRDDKDLNDQQRLLNEYRELSERYEKRFTEISEAARDRQWGLYDKAYRRAFTPSEREQLDDLRAEGDHELERERRRLSTLISDSGYYDRAQGEQRENFRQSHPDVDGALWALGRTSKVRSERARSKAAEAASDLFGRRVRTRTVKVADDVLKQRGTGSTFGERILESLLEQR